MPLVDIVKLRALVREWRLEAEEYKRLARMADRNGEPRMASRYLIMVDVVNEKADALEGILGVEVRSERP